MRAGDATQYRTYDKRKRHMKRNTLIITIMTLFAVVSMGAFAGCDEDGSLTKRDLCYKLADAYCNHNVELGCGDYASCYDNNEGVCNSVIPEGCKATAADSEKINHDIEMIIESKTTCAGLTSIDGYLDHTVEDMAATCGSTDTTGMDIGFMCETLIASICMKVGNLNCDPSVTLTQCESQLMSSGVMVIAGHSCISAGDHTPGTSAQQTAFDSMIAEVNNATSCAEFGY